MLINIIFAGFVLRRNITEKSAGDRAFRELSDILAQSGIELSENALGEAGTVKLMYTNRDVVKEAEIAAEMLGDNVREDLGGNITRYSGENGTITFRQNGEFEAQLSNYSMSGAVWDDVDSIMKKFGSSYERLTLREGDYAKTVEVMCTAGGAPVYNCCITFEFHRGNLRSISGRRVPDGETRSTDADVADSITAVIKLAKAKSDGLVDCQKIVSVELGCALTVNTSGEGSVYPVYRIKTDVGDCFIDAVNGDYLYL